MATVKTAYKIAQGERTDKTLPVFSKICEKLVLVLHLKDQTATNFCRQRHHIPVSAEDLRSFMSGRGFALGCVVRDCN